MMLVCFNTRYASAQAPTTPTTIPTVTIRSSLLSDSVKWVPLSVAVMQRAKLLENDATLLTDLINQVPGVYMQQGNFNTNRIAIRGIGARSQFSTNRLRTYVDGIPITTAAGETILEDIDLELLERVEVVKGPASSLYGAGLGGAIHMYSLLPQKTQLRAGVSAGSFGMRKYHLSGSAGNERGALQLSYNQLERDGWRQNSGYDRRSLTLNGQYALGERTSVRAYANLIRLKAFIPSSINAVDFASDPSLADRNWLAAEGYESYDRLIAGLNVEHRFTERLLWSTSLFGQIRDAYEPRPFDIQDVDMRMLGFRSQVRYKHSIFQKEATVEVGLENLYEWYELRLIENLYRDFPGQGSIAGSTFAGNDQERSNLNAFAQWRVQLSPKMAVEAGLNANSTAYSLSDRFPSPELDQSGSYRYGSILSPRLGLSRQVAADAVMYASVSHGFSVPGVEETLTPAGEINLELLPETGINYELGLKADWLDRKLHTEFALYTIAIRNLLVARRVAEDQFIGLNAGRTQHTGAEGTVAYRQLLGKKWYLKPALTASLHHYRFSDFVDGNNDFSGNALTGVPTHTANFNLTAQSTGGWACTFNLLNVGSIPLNDANSLSADAYTLMNARVAYTFSLAAKIECELHFGINNLADARYAASILPNAAGFGGAAPRYFYPGDPRSFYGGLRLTL